MLHQPNRMEYNNNAKKKKTTSLYYWANVTMRINF
jgi:hypothetical protein